MGNIPSTTKNTTPVDNSLTGQITNLPKRYSYPEIENFYSTNLKAINKEIGNEDLHTSLSRLGKYVLENAKSSRSRILAFEIYWTARSLLPEKDVPWVNLPSEIWKRILPQEPLTGANLFISSKFSMMAHERMNKEWTCLKSVGFKNTSGALAYAIRHKLSSVDLWNLGKVDLPHLEELVNNCPDLKVLGLNDLTLSEAQVVPILNKLLKLQVLNLCLNFDSSTHEVLEPISKMNELHTLGLSNFKGYPLGLTQAIKNLSKIISLHLDSSGIFGNTLLEALAPHPELVTLILTNCNCISGQGLVDIAKQQKNLQFLNLTQCTQIPTQSIVEATAHLPKLKELALYGVNIKHEDKNKIISQLPHLEKLVVNGWAKRPLANSLAKDVPDFNGKYAD